MELAIKLARTYGGNYDNWVRMKRTNAHKSDTERIWTMIPLLRAVNSIFKTVSVHSSTMQNKPIHAVQATEKNDWLNTTPPPRYYRR